MVNYINNKQGEKRIDGITHNILNELTKKLQKITGNVISVQQLRASRIILWLKQYNIRQVQYYAGIKYLSSMEKYKQQEMDSLREELEKYFPLG